MNNSAKSCLKQQNKIRLLYIVGFASLALAAAVGLSLGSTRLIFADILQDLSNSTTSSNSTLILFYVRTPRIVSSLVCGAALAVSGAIIQGVLSNKLASPSIIGVNSGAGLAVTVCTALGFYGGWQLSLFSFIGAFVTVTLVTVGARKWNASRGTVILIGVAVNSLLSAVSDTIVTFVPTVSILSNDFKIGEFSSVTYARLIPAALVIIVTISASLTLTTQLDVLSLGEDTAKSLGMNTTAMRTVFLLLAALLAGCAVSLAGLLSFVGLIVPHAIRRLAGSKSSHLMALCAIFGASFVSLCDTVARTAFAPYEIPVGIIMAFLGAPFFIFILIKGKGGSADD